MVEFFDKQSTVVQLPKITKQKIQMLKDGDVTCAENQAAKPSFVKLSNESYPHPLVDDSARENVFITVYKCEAVNLFMVLVVAFESSHLFATSVYMYRS